MIRLESCENTSIPTQNILIIVIIAAMNYAIIEAAPAVAR